VCYRLCGKKLMKMTIIFVPGFSRNALGRLYR
jgi:hypothetical protein